MKNIFLIVYSAALLTSTQATAQKKIVKPVTSTNIKTNTEREKSFAISVLNAIREKNMDAWMRLYPTNEEYKDILQTGLAAKAEGLTQQVIDDIIVKRKKEAAAVYAKQFTDYCKAADSIGVNWQNVVFEKISFMEVYPEPVKLRYIDAVIWFKSNKQNYVIDGVQAVDIASGYRLQALSPIRQVAEIE